MNKKKVNYWLMWSQFQQFPLMFIVMNKTVILPVNSKSMMTNKKLLFLFAAGAFMLLAHIPSLAQQQKAKVATIAFYNLENLFDTVNDTLINDEEFLPEGVNKWTDERYQKKLANMSKVISQIGEEYIKGGPTLIGVSEIENRKVLEDLINMPALANSGYGIVHYDSPDYRGVDVGLLYRKHDFTVINTVSARLLMPGHEHWRSRDQLVVTGLLEGDTISVIVNHWPSRGNLPPFRAEAARLTRSLADSLFRVSRNAKIVIMGDLNDDPVDESVNVILGAEGREQKVKQKMLFNPMWKMYKEGIGSLAYRDSWNLFDQTILSAPLLDKKSGSWYWLKTKVFNKPYLISQQGQYAGYPFRTYAGGAYEGGYSDHLPVYTVIVKEVH
ncbi:MAG TPA: endonuclease/exonuclease/phosphatase family protein [Bacteroidales bacterium]|nr:endonuclease/exonuclease/phosphatase family protein [Bacteroidales bacterium]